MIEGKRAIIFVGVILHVLLLNQPVSSYLKADPDINDHRIVSRAYERYGHPNSSVTNRGEIRRYRSDVFRFRNELSRILTNVALNPTARFSFVGRSDERLQFERERRIVREPYNNRQERNRAINDPVRHEPIQRRVSKIDLDNRRYFRFSETRLDRSIRRSTYSFPKSRFLKSESPAPLATSDSRDRRIESRVRDTRDSEYLLRSRDLERNVDQIRNRRTRSMRTVEVDRNRDSSRVLSKASETPSLTDSFLKSTLFNYFPQNSLLSFEMYQINDFVVSTIAGILLYDVMGAMTQKKAAAVKNESLGSFVEKMVFAVRKMVAH